MKFIKIEDIPIPDIKNITIDNENIPTENLYYIPPPLRKFNNYY